MVLTMGLNGGALFWFQRRSLISIEMFKGRIDGVYVVV